MKTLKLILIIFSCLITLSLSSRISWADPTAEVLYLETQLDDGWRYDYTVKNTTLELGYDLFAWYVDIWEQISILDGLSSPTNWGLIYEIGLLSFINWYTPEIGPPPGDDIKPGDNRSGFSFQTDLQLGDLPFTAYFTNPYDPNNPSSYEGTTTVVPEPITILLIGSGLAGVGLLRRKKKNF